MQKVLFVILILLLNTCRNFEDETKADFINYFENERAVFVKAGINAVTESNRALKLENKAARKVLKKKVLPAYSEYIKALENVKARTYPVIVLHQVFITAQKIQHSALKLVYKYTASNDEKQIQKAQHFFEVSKSLIDWYDEEFKRLLRSFSIPVSLQP